MKKNNVYDVVKDGNRNQEEIVFNEDLHSELVFVNGIAKMKNYYRKTIEIKVQDEFLYRLYLDGEYEITVCYLEEEDGYTAYDAVESYGKYKTIKEAVKGYMDDCYAYSTDEEEGEISCKSCGDGGCIHCKPNDFL